jgi:hypothetical protein
MKKEINYNLLQSYKDMNASHTIGYPKEINTYLSKGKLVCRFDKALIREFLKNTKNSYVGIYIHRKTKMPIMHMGGKVLSGIVIDKWGFDDVKEGIRK